MNYKHIAILVFSFLLGVAAGQLLVYNCEYPTMIEDFGASPLRHYGND